MSSEKITRSILIPLEEGIDVSVDSRYVGVSIWPVVTAYTRKSGSELVQLYAMEVGSDTPGKIFERRSPDNGRTWSEPSLFFEPHRTDDGVARMIEPCLFLDEDEEKVLLFYDSSLYPEVSYSGDVARFTMVFLRISDRGGPFGEPVQLVQRGYDEKNWARDVTCGINSAPISFCAPLKLSSGRILLPAVVIPQGADLSNPFLIQDGACCFIGMWKGDKIEWDLSEVMWIDPKLSTRGLDEPTVAELSDGTIFMVCRASNSTDTRIQGYKWRSLSFDGGYTWTDLSPLGYDTGEAFFSPATGSRLIRHSVNGKLYWFGNIVGKNTDGNRPRHPLQIAEVDEERRAIRKDTVRVIEDRQPGDSPFVQFSNFRVYEDRETGEFVLTLARIQMVSERDLSSPAYQYRIAVL